LGVRFAVHQRKPAAVVLPSAEGLRAAGGGQRGTSEDWLAQFSAHGQRMGKGIRVYARRSEDFASTQNIATTSQVYGAPQMEAKRELQRRLVDFVKQRAEQEGWKLKGDSWIECPTKTASVQ